MRIPLWTLALMMITGTLTHAQQPLIAVAEDQTWARVLSSLGYAVEVISLDRYTDPDGLAQYRVICHPGQRLNALQIDGLREYVRRGGSAYLGRLFPDLAGARYGNGGYGVGWIQAYRVVAEHPSLKSLPVGQWLPVPEQLQAAHVRSVNALEATTGLLVLQMQAQPVQRVADPEHDFRYEFTGKQQTWGWAAVHGYGDGKVFALPHYSLPAVIEYLGEAEAAQAARALLRDIFDWLISDDRAGLPVTQVPPIRPPRDWPGLDAIEIPNSRARTVAFIGNDEMFGLDVPTILRRCEELNVGTLMFFASDSLLTDPGTLQAQVSAETLARLQELRAAGLTLGVCFGRVAPKEVSVWAQDREGKLSDRWPSWLDENFRAYCLHLNRIWAPHVTYIGPDEWGFSPASWSFDELCVAKFKADYGYTDADIQALRANPRADTPVARDWWRFMVDVQDDLLIAMADAAKQANPQVITAISYVTHERNWHGNGVRRAADYYDCLYDCQFYWYGRWSDTPLNAALATKAIGWAKNLRAEYPDKELWVGWAPYYAGASDTPGQWWNHVSYYHNTPEEFFPYLCSLYACADKVFIFTIFNGQGPGQGSDLDFRAVSQLASRAVPTVSRFAPGNIAYYWNPEENRDVWRTVGRPWAAHEDPVVQIGVLNQFADVDVTADLSRYQNVIISGYYRPPDEVLDLSRRRVLAWFNPQHDRTGAVAAPLAPGAYTGLTTLASGHYQIEGDVATGPHLLFDARAIEGARHPLRWVTVDGQRLVIAATDEEGRFLLDSTNPWYLRQNAARQLIAADFRRLGWLQRDCPQFVGPDRVVAFSLLEPRTAVVALPRPQSGRVRLVLMDAVEGIRRNEVVDWRERLEVDLPPHSVLVARAG